MKKKHKITLLVIGIFLTLSLIIGLSYAYYIFSVSQSGSNIVRSDCFEITYSDGNAINLSDTIPLREDDINNIDAYVFTIENVCNNAAKYDINIETLNTSSIDLNAIRYKLDDYASYILGGITNNDLSSIVNTTIASSSKTINTGIIEGRETKTFNLKLWIDENATVSQSANKSFLSKVVVNSTIQPNFKSAYLIEGQLFNEQIKKLVNSSYTYNSDVSEILAFERSNSAPSEGTSYVDVADSTSKNPFLVWYDNGTIYYYTNANRIYFNENSKYSFQKLTELTELDLSNFDLSRATNTSYMFSNDLKLVSLNLGDNFDTSLVTDMNFMFTSLSELETLELGNKFDTSKVTNMSAMFLNLNNLQELDLKDKFDTSKVTDMSWMFGAANKLHSLNLGNKFDTSNVTNMKKMFQGLNGFKDDNVLNLGDKFDTSNVTDMESMFSVYHANSLNLGEKFNTSKVTNMKNMFNGSYALQSLDLSNFDTSNVTDMSGMFHNMIYLQTVYVSDKFNIDNVSESEGMFYSAIRIVGGSGTTYNSSYTDITYARIDDPTNGKPGYFTLKTN